MAKLMLLKKTEVSVPEDKKGKQIAVKESNITSLKNFFVSNYKPVVEETTQISLNNLSSENNATIPTPEQPEPVIVNPFNEINSTLTNPIENSGIQMETNNTIQENKPIMDNTSVINETPFLSSSQSMEYENESIDPIKESKLESQSNETSVWENDFPFLKDSVSVADIPTGEEGTNDTQAIKLVQENEFVKDLSLEEEMDPELKEIKTRLDQVILDLNNYKKKIKMLEDEVNQNLEKSREVLKDTQAAAKIMSIHQERQNQIMNELNNGSNTLNDSMRILQKDTEV